MLKDFPKEAKDYFDSRNKGRARIESGKIKTAFDLVLMSGESAGKLVEGGRGWTGFHEVYAKSGISLVSRPGVNADRTKALLYVGTSCDMLCGVVSSSSSAMTANSGRSQTRHEIVVSARVELAHDHWDLTVHFDIPDVKWGMKDPSTFVLRVEKTVAIALHASGPNPWVAQR